MIDVVNGTAVLRMLDKVGRRPDLYRKVVVSAPFVDKRGIELLNRMNRDFRGKRGPSIDLVLTPELADRLAGLASSCQRFRIVAQRGLHAKIYALIGFDPVANEMLVTSSNLTTAGIHRNLEVGLVVRGRTNHLSSLIERTTRRVTQRQGGTNDT